ncbi:MAG: DUF4331 family protein [Chloroflexota bacterium]
MRSVFRVAALGASMLALTVGAAPFIAGAADHLDAPSLGSLSAGSVRGDRDINDVYVFQGANTSKAVIAVTTNPAAGVLAPTIYGTNVRYNINVDNNGDLRPDVTYTARFGPRGSGPDSKQALTLTRNGMVVARGATGNTVQIGGTFRGKVFAGLRSDPFFFDLLGFRGSTGLGGRDRLCDSDPVDFFADLNTLGLVIEVPDAALGRHIGVWATTQELVNGSWVARDQMGRPAINTVFNHTAADKELFNVTPPAHQADAGKPFRKNVSDTLQALSALDTEGPYSAAQADALAGVLIPDVLTYDTATKAVGPLNGRALRDDVIDVELAITTGADPLALFADRDARGGINSDCVGPHHDYQSSWPYLGQPH